MLNMIVLLQQIESFLEIAHVYGWLSNIKYV